MSSPPKRESGNEVHDVQAQPPVLEPTNKLRWSRPEITSFKPIADAQGAGYKAGEGINNSF